MEDIELWASNKRNFEYKKRKKGKPIGRFDHIAFWIIGSIEDYAQRMDVKNFNQYEDGAIDVEELIKCFMYNNHIKPSDRSWTDREFLE